MSEVKFHKYLKLVSCFFMLAMSAISYSDSMEAEMASKLDGSWLSEKWNYGFRIEGMSGYVTQWNYKYNPEDKTRVGDLILKIEKYTAAGFVGTQQFFSGKVVAVVGSVIDANNMKLEAGPEVWLMIRSK